MPSTLITWLRDPKMRFFNTAHKGMSSINIFFRSIFDEKQGN